MNRLLFGGPWPPHSSHIQQCRSQLQGTPSWGPLRKTWIRDLSNIFQFGARDQRERNLRKIQKSELTLRDWEAEESPVEFGNGNPRRPSWGVSVLHLKSQTMSNDAEKTVKPIPQSSKSSLFRFELFILWRQRFSQRKSLPSVSPVCSACNRGLGEAYNQEFSFCEWKHPLTLCLPPRTSGVMALFVPEVFKMPAAPSACCLAEMSALQKLYFHLQASFFDCPASFAL